MPCLRARRRACCRPRATQRLTPARRVESRSVCASRVLPRLPHETGMNNSSKHLILFASWLAACSPSSGEAVAPQAQGTAGFGMSGGLVPPSSAGLIVPVAGTMSQSSAATSRPGTGIGTGTNTGTMAGAAGTPASRPGAGAAGSRAPWAGGSFPGGMLPGGALPMGMAPVGAAGGGAPAGMAGAAGGGGVITAEPSATGDRATPEGVCARWKADRADIGEGTWTGDVAACDPGDMDPMARAAALRVLNLYRWLADLPEITSDPTKDKEAQACALLMRANNSLSHMPPPDWMCYMDEGAKAAGRCNISSGPAVSSVDGYMVDPGNDTTIGHRRWILSNSIGPTGIGGTDRASCLMTTGNMRVGKAWQAWPAPGVIPIQAMQQGFSRWVTSIDSTGWTVQSDTVNLGSAQVTVMSDGMMMPVTVTQLQPGYGSRYALRFNPMGWMTTPGKTYSVTVSGASQPIQYDVQVIDCQ